MINKIKSLISVVDKKSSVLYQNVIMSLGVKGLAILVSLVNMPVFMDYFQDSTVLGLWFTLLSMLNWILTFDLGIGNGLRNYLVHALEKNDRLECKKLISSSYCSVGVIAIVLSALTILLVPLADWNTVCNIPQETVSPEVLIHTLQILLIGIWLQFLLKLVNTILYAMQKSAIPNFLLLISSILLLGATFVLRTGDVQQNLVRLSYAYVFTANLPMLAATVVVFRTKLKGMGLQFSCWNKNNTKQIVGLGLSFLLLQLLSMASFNTREFYIMRFVDPAGVVPYQVYHKIFSLISTFFILATTPLWSAITQASAQKDIEWIRKTYRKGIVLFCIFVAGSILVVALGQVLVNIWLAEKAIEMNMLYSALFAVFNIMYMWISLHSHFENGLGKLYIQKIGYIIAAAMLPILAYLLTRTSSNWVLVLVANIVVLLPLCILQPLHMRKLVKEWKEIDEVRE